MGIKKTDRFDGTDAPGRTTKGLKHRGSAETSAFASEDDQPAEASFEAGLRNALVEDRISAARTLVANAEAILAAHEAATAASPRVPKVSRTDLAAAKARIAMATGDGAAARAILVQAIEAAPKAASLRSLMTEVMMATGRASDVRPVLQHLGTAPEAARHDVKERDHSQDSSR